MKWYVEVPEFEMLIQLDDEGINELKEMINDDVLKIKITANRLKIAMSDEELLEKSRSGISIGYFPPDDLIDENGVKAEILENNQIKINVSPFIFKFTPKPKFVNELQPQLMSLKSLYKIRFDFPSAGGEVISSNLRSVTEKYKALDYSSKEDPLPEIEYTYTNHFERIYAIPEINYKNADKEFNGSIRKMLEVT